MKYGHDDKDVSPVFERIIARAVMDSEFRKQLLADKDAVAREYKLEGADIAALQRVDPKYLESARGLAAMIPVVHLRIEDKD